MACSDPSQFRSLVAPHCTDLRSDKCTWALVKAGGAFGPGCLDLSIVASPEPGMPPYRDYVCPRSTGVLARLCGPPKQQVASDAGAGARTGSSYGTLAAGLGVSTAVLGLTTAGAVGLAVHMNKVHQGEINRVTQERNAAQASTHHIMNNARRLKEEFTRDSSYDPADDHNLSRDFKHNIQKEWVEPSEVGSQYISDTGRL